MKKSLILIAVFGLLMLTTSFASAENDSPHRIGISGGYFMPSGEYKDAVFTLPYKAGGTFGVEYRYLLPNNIGIGTFFDYNAFSSDKKRGADPYSDFEAKADVTTTVVGVSVLYEISLDKAATIYV
ncbi:MAG: hypothetical protein LBH94_02785, partial [Deltaproteobacteria bacterium]|nr:hypothetical protein [Deltaproteobacteria bacterium]